MRSPSCVQDVGLVAKTCRNHIRVVAVVLAPHAEGAGTTYLTPPQAGERPFIATVGAALCGRPPGLGAILSSPETFFRFIAFQLKRDRY